MESIIPFPLAYMMASAFLAVLGFILLLNIFGLPANWIILGLVGVWKWLNPDAANMGWLFFTLMIGLALVGEALELGMQIVKAKRYGSTSSGTFMGMVGAIAGAILLAPLFFGIGALIGALLGAWIGCFLTERAKGMGGREAANAAFGAMMGRFLGTVCKCGVGGAMLALTGQYIWPKAPVEPGQMVQLLTFFA